MHWKAKFGIDYDDNIVDRSTMRQQQLNNQHNNYEKWILNNLDDDVENDEMKQKSSCT